RTSCSCPEKEEDSGWAWNENRAAGARGLGEGGGRARAAAIGGQLNSSVALSESPAASLRAKASPVAAMASQRVEPRSASSAESKSSARASGLSGVPQRCR